MTLLRGRTVAAVTVPPAEMGPGTLFRAEVARRLLAEELNAQGA